MRSRSRDDSSRARQLHISGERRARSASPVKSRRHLASPVYGEQSSRSLDDLGSVISGASSNVSYEQLRLLSESPISKRLHIAPDSSKYIIPIPFTLRLPPKLSKKNIQQEPSRSTNPQRITGRGILSQRQKKLVYTGYGYEILDSSDSQDEHNKVPERPESPRRIAPPPVSQNNSKPMRHIHRKCLSSSDVLSVIDETSINSRASSLKSKNEKSLPDVPLADTGITEQRGRPIVQTAPESTSEKQVLPYPVSDNHLLKRKFTKVTFAHSPSLKYSSDTKLINDPNLEKERSPRPTLNLVANLIPRSQTDQKNSPYFSNISPIHNAQYLKFHKRTFSDETYASTVSDPSTVGDVSNLYPQPHATVSPSIREEILPKQDGVGERQDGGVSESEENESSDEGSEETNSASANSWDEKSELNVRQEETSFISSKCDEHEFKEMNSPGIKELPPLPARMHSNHEEKIFTSASKLPSSQPSTTFTDQKGVALTPNLDKKHSKEEDAIDDTIGDDTGEECVTRAVSKLYQFSDESFEGNKDATIEELREMSLDDSIGSNQGAGKSFSFPNNSGNSTNSEEAKRKTLASSSQRSSQYGRMVNGAIIIPELDEFEKELKEELMRGDDSTSLKAPVVSADKESISDNESDLEPLGVPSSAARSVVKNGFHHLADGESDTEDESMNMKTSLYSSSSNSRSVPNLMPEDQLSDKLSNLTIESTAPSGNDHMRPVRHKRFHSIHNLSFIPQKSYTDYEDSAANEPKSSPRKEESNLNPIDNVSHVSVSREVQPDSHMKINVEDPPSQVTYAVDFKEALPRGESKNDLSENYIKKIYSNTLSPPSNAHNLGASETIQSTLVNQKPSPGFAGKPSSENQSASSYSSYQSSRSLSSRSETSISDTDSVVIDLTKDKYDVCTIQRNNSVLSYRSVTEMREGKDVEVVIVEDDERDELESIYSKYLKSATVQDRKPFRSSLSTASTASFDSNVESVTQLQLKNREELLKQYKESVKNIKSNYTGDTIKKLKEMKKIAQIASQKQNKQINVPNSKSLNQIDSLLGKSQHGVDQLEKKRTTYFDFSNSNYDFTSFMKQQQKT